MQDNWHTYENGLCFFRLLNGHLCNYKAVKALHDEEGNGYGIFCYMHLKIKIEELALRGVYAK